MATHKYTNEDSSPRFRAVGYVRVSREGRHSVDAQMQAISERSDHDGREFLRFYVDEGVSAFGGNSQNRPAFNEMMEGARAGEFDVLIVDRMDRFGRDSSHSIETLKELQDLGTELVSVREEMGTDSCPVQFTMTEKYPMGTSHSVSCPDNTAHP